MTKTTFPGMPDVAAGFEAPLEMLLACHDRIRTRCATLLRLRSHVEERGVDQEALAAARGILRYFDVSAPHHHDDEEQDVFPALLEAMAGSDAVCIREMTESLAGDHRELASLWIAVRSWLVALEKGKAPPEHTVAIDSFVELYQRHAEREEQELFPMAKRLLDDEALERIGQAMRARRGVDSA